jgi:hypothetical protein
MFDFVALDEFYQKFKNYSSKTSKTNSKTNPAEFMPD